MNVNSYYTRPWIFNRYSTGPIAPHLVSFSEFLATQGYSYATGQRYVREVGHLSRWLGRQGTGITALNEETIRHYLCFRYQNAQVQVKRGPYLQLLNYLRKTGNIATDKPVATPLDKCIDNYREHMVKNQGLTEETIRGRIRVARKFLSLQFEENRLKIPHIRPCHVEQYFLTRSHHCRTATLKAETSALRCFFRFLQFQGDISSQLVECVPTVPSWRHTIIPSFLTTDNTNLLLRRSECETPQGQRDKAILLLLIRLGLRAIEICRLTLDDIDWDAGSIVIFGKSGKRDCLPLLHDVGKAISTYLYNGRPQCSTRNVFVRAIAPFKPFSSSCSVANLVRNALRRANLNPPRKGSHLLRRSFATMMLQEGASLNEIGQILRHQKADTTAIYAKVDLARLRPISRPWPEGGEQ